MADVAVRRPRMNWAVVVAAAVVLAAGTAFGLLVFRSQQLPDGVVPVAWDRTVCAHCRMHVGEPGFAAQAKRGERAAVREVHADPVPAHRLGVQQFLAPFMVQPGGALHP